MNEAPATTDVPFLIANGKRAHVYWAPVLTSVITSWEAIKATMPDTSTINDNETMKAFIVSPEADKLVAGRNAAALGLLHSWHNFGLTTDVTKQSPERDALVDRTLRLLKAPPTVVKNVLLACAAGTVWEFDFNERMECVTIASFSHFAAAFCESSRFMSNLFRRLRDLKAPNNTHAQFLHCAAAAAREVPTVVSVVELRRKDAELHVVFNSLPCTHLGLQSEERVFPYTRLLKNNGNLVQLAKLLTEYSDTIHSLLPVPDKDYVLLHFKDAEQPTMQLPLLHVLQLGWQDLLSPQLDQEQLAQLLQQPSAQQAIDDHRIVFMSSAELEELAEFRREKEDAAASE